MNAALLLHDQGHHAAWRGGRTATAMLKLFVRVIRSASAFFLETACLAIMSSNMPMRGCIAEVLDAAH